MDSPAGLALSRSITSARIFLSELLHPALYIFCSRHNGGRVVYYLHVRDQGRGRLPRVSASGLFDSGSRTLNQERWMSADFRARVVNVTNAVALWGGMGLVCFQYGLTTAVAVGLFAYYLKPQWEL